jgi:hypothetical protein
MAASSASKPATPKADRFPGRVRRVNDFWRDASQSRELAVRMIPLLSRYILVMAGIAVFAMFVSLVSLWTRPDPLVLLSFPDGTTRCTPPSINPTTGKTQTRPTAQVLTCNELEASNEDGESQ